MGLEFAYLCLDLEANIGGWGETNREIVLFRFVSCVLARSGREVGTHLKTDLPPFVLNFFVDQASTYLPVLDLRKIRFLLKQQVATPCGQGLWALFGFGGQHI